MKQVLAMAVMLALVGSADAHGSDYRYTLPGDWRWPSATQFMWFKKYIQGEVYLKTDPEYAPYTFSTRTNTPQPAMMVYPACVKDVQKAIRFARWHKMRISVFSTGHHADVRNIADNAVHIVMTNFNEKLISDVDGGKVIKIGPGQTFSEIAAHVQQETNNEWAMATGADSSVGPYGWTVGGGHGYLSRMYGLGVDHVVSMEIVLTSGFLVTASETQHPDLFWALRGSGGSSYGVVTSMTVKLHPTPQKVTSFFGVFFPQGDYVAQAYHNFVSGAPKEVGGYYLTLGTIPGNPVFIIGFCYGDDCDHHISKLSAIPGCVPGILPNSCHKDSDMTYYGLVNALAPSTGGNQYTISAAVKADKAFELIQATTAWVAKPENFAASKFCTQSTVLGGEMKNLDTMNQLTSVSANMREGDIQVTCIGAWDDATSVADKQAFVADMDSWGESVVKPLGNNGWVYWNEAQHNFPNGDWQQRYWGEATYNRLNTVKKLYDPFNSITCYHCVGWDFADSVDPAVCPAESCTCSNNKDGTCNN